MYVAVWPHDPTRNWQQNRLVVYFIIMYFTHSFKQPYRRIEEVTKLVLKQE